MPVRPSTLAALLISAFAWPAVAGQPHYRVYNDDQAPEALRVAQRECKPLVLHFVPTEKDAANQRREYYGPHSPIPREDLERMVVVIIPKDRYPDFARQMGIQDAGGIRTVSPYEFTFTDRWSLTTVKESKQWRQFSGTVTQQLRAQFSREKLWKFPSAVDYDIDIIPIKYLETNEPGPIKLNRYLLLDQPRPRFSCDIWVRVDVGGVVICRQRQALPAREARDYFRESAREFDDYAADRFPKVLNEPRAGELALLAGAAYVATRHVPGYQAQLKELFTTRLDGKFADDIHEACLEGLLATTEDRRSLARFLAYVGSQPDPAAKRHLCIDGLRRLPPEATEEMFAYLGRSTNGVHRRRLAWLIQTVTRTRSPQPLRFWRVVSDCDMIEDTIAEWLGQVDAEVSKGH